MRELLTWLWPRSLLKLPFAIRLSICMLSFLICFGIYIHIHADVHNGNLLVIPMFLGAWIFEKKGALICLFSIGLAIFFYNTYIFQTLLWPTAALYSFFTGAIILSILGIVLVSFRKMFEATEASHVQIEENEQQILLAYEQQRRFNQVKNQFIINVNHELRTPLAAAYGYFEFLQALLKQNGQLDHATHASYIENALYYCQELQAMVNNVLDTIEISNGRTPPQMENTSLIATVYDVFDSIDAFCRQQERIIYLDISPELNVHADIQCLRHILHNLLSNAFKFSPVNEPITISATELEDSSEVCIHVKDCGPGIPPEEIQQIFEPFVRLERDLAGTVRGVGLGLSISKHLTEEMGGRIWVESTGKPGQGSCFSFTLPCATHAQSTKIAS